MINHILNQFKNCADRKSAIEYMLTSQSGNSNLLYKERNGAYVFQNYYLSLRIANPNTNFYKTLYQNLKLVNPICKTSSPEIIGTADTKDNLFTAIAYRINYCNNADLIPFFQVGNLKPEKIQLFKSEQIKLIEEKSLYNPNLFNNLNHFYITPDTNNIVFENWNVLEQIVDTDQKQSLITQINNLL